MTKDKSQQRSVFTIAAIGAVLVLIALMALELRRSYLREADNAAAITQSMSRTLEQQLLASMQRIDLIEQEAAYQYALHLQGQGLPREAMNPMLARHLERVPGLLSLRLIDEEGNYVFDASGVASTANVADRRYFRVQEASPDTGFFPEGPLFSRVANQWTMTFSRGVRASNGRFLGIVQSSIEVNALAAALGQATTKDGNTATLLNGEGKLVARFPAQPEAVGTVNISDKLRTLIAESAEEANYTGKSNVDGIERFYTLKRIGSYPFFLLVGLSQDQVLESWRRTAAFYATLSLALLIGLVLFILRLSHRSRSFQRSADEQRRLTSEVFANALEGIIVTDKNSVILSANRAISEISGYGEDDLVGATPALFKSGLYDKAFYQNFWKTLTSTGRWQGEILNKRKSGELFPGWLSVSMIRDEAGQPLRFLGVLTDISAQKAAQQRLQFANAELLRLTEIMAHHLQEPSRRLVTFSHALKRALGGRAGEEDVAGPLQFIEQQALRLRALIRDIQLYLVVDQPLSQVVSLSLTLIAERVLEAKSESLAEIGAETDIQPGMPCVQMDERRLSNMLDILLDNAIRYRRQDRPLSLSISAEIVGRRAKLRFADNGRGIEPEYRELVFQLFERLYAQPGDEGTGIGLSIVRRIVEQTGGKAYIEETHGGGATIILDLPLGNEVEA